MAHSNEKVGMRGFEAIGFVLFVVVILAISIITTITNLAIIYKLRLFPSYELMTFVSNNIVLNGKVDLDKIHLANNQIKGVSSISGNSLFEVGSSLLSIDDDGIQIKSDRGFYVRSKETGKQIFPIDFNRLTMPSISSLSLPGGAKDVNKIRSPTNQDLNIHSSGKIKIRGNEGIEMEGKRIEFNASSIFLSSINQSIIFDAVDGVYINMKTFKSISNGINDGTSKLENKLCVCASNGRIFQIELRHHNHGCADVRFPESANPCY